MCIAYSRGLRVFMLMIVTWFTKEPVPPPAQDSGPGGVALLSSAAAPPPPVDLAKMVRAKFITAAVGIVEAHIARLATVTVSSSSFSTMSAHIKGPRLFHSS